MITLKDIEEAYRLISGELVATPLKETRHFSKMIGTSLYLKMENLQHTGSFKVRGATHRIMKLTSQEKSKGVVSASAGNHAQGVASISSRLGIESTIFMPESTPFVKVVSTKGFGANIVLVGKNYDEAYEEALKFCQKKGAIFIHPFEDDDIIAGQGTVALEILDKLSQFDRILIPIGGGGLMCGMAIALKEKNSKIEVIGVQTEAAPSMYNAFHQNKIEGTVLKPSIAEGITVKKASPKMFEIIKKYVDDVVLVSEEEIARAILLLIERSKTVVEGAGAASMAAALKGHAKGKTVVLLSGGNIDVTTLSKIIDRGLSREGRLLRISVTLVDKPGSLHGVTKIVSEAGANILQIQHDRLAAGLTLGETEVVLAMETKGQDHVEELLKKLKDAGYSYRKL